MAVTTLGYAILGLLARQSLSGYDLARRLRRPIGFYWTARHSQIYPELRRLTALGTPLVVTAGVAVGVALLGRS
ncbi:MAG TPA: PadR family transcriptional regulator [Candidatus Dormibacteraeota bacterium]